MSLWLYVNTHIPRRVTERYLKSRQNADDMPHTVVVICRGYVIFLKNGFYARRGSSIDFKENFIQFDNNNLIIAIFVINHLRHLVYNLFIL